MNRTLKKLLLVAGSTLPALAMFAGTATADVAANNKLKNGDFENGTAHWTGSALPKLSISPAWGSLFANNQVNAAYATLGTASQCVPVTSNFTYELSGKMFVPQGQDRTGYVNLEVQYYAAPGCSGYQKTYVTTPLATTAGAWKSQKMTAKAPKDAESALVRVRVHKNSTKWLENASKPFYAFFDDVQLISKTKIQVGPALPNPGIFDTDPDSDPTPAPTPTPQPADEPEDEPEDNGETVEEDVPAQPTPEVPQQPADDSGDSPSQDQGSGQSDQPVSNSGSDNQESDSPSANTATEQGNTEPLAASSDDGALESTNGSAPTPAAPAAGNADTADRGLLGPTELGIAGAAALVLVGLAFIAGSRRGRKPEPRELPFE